MIQNGKPIPAAAIVWLYCFECVFLGLRKQFQPLTYIVRISGGGDGKSHCSESVDGLKQTLGKQCNKWKRRTKKLIVILAGVGIQIQIQTTSWFAWGEQDTALRNIAPHRTIPLWQQLLVSHLLFANVSNLILFSHSSYFCDRYSVIFCMPWYGKVYTFIRHPMVVICVSEYLLFTLAERPYNLWLNFW